MLIILFKKLISPGPELISFNFYKFRQSIKKPWTIPTLSFSRSARARAKNVRSRISANSIPARARAGIEFADILDLTFFASGIIIYRAIKIDQNSMYV